MGDEMEEIVRVIGGFPSAGSVSALVLMHVITYFLGKYALITYLSTR